MRRHALGIISLLLIVAAIYGLYTYGLKDNHASLVSSMCMRIGMVLGAIWLAFPQLHRLFSKTPPWFVALLGSIGLAIIVRPRSIVFLGPIILGLIALYFVGWLMKPPPRRPPSSKARR